MITRQATRLSCKRKTEAFGKLIATGRIIMHGHVVHILLSFTLLLLYVARRLVGKSGLLHRSSI
jgi:hypothetical protein